MRSRRPGRLAAISGVVAVATAIGAAAIGGCGGSAVDSTAGATALRDYLARVEPIRLGVNRLLDGADPILEAYGNGRIGAKAAQRRLNRLESRFAAYTTAINAISEAPPELMAAQRAYAHTYVLEDAYLSTLATAIPTRAYDELPKTQNAQRAAIVAWRTRLHVVAGRLGVRLPPDIEVAGRGEIAPSPLGS